MSSKNTTRRFPGKLRGTSLAQGRNGNALLLFHNQLVFLGGGFGLESLTGLTALEKVHQYVSDQFEIIATRLFHSQMIIDGRVTRRSRQGSAFPLGNVLERPWMAVPFGQTKIDAPHTVAIAASAVRDKVGRFDVPMNQVPLVHQLDAFEQLIGDHEHRFEREFPSAFVELIFEGGTEQIHHH